jgi:hypothetical protein
MRLAEFIKQAEKLKIGFSVEGYINVEGGNAAVATKIFEDSECSEPGIGSPPKDCPDCDRSPRNFANTTAGSGDGVYVIFGIHLLSNAEINIGAFAVFDENYLLANSVRQAVEEGMPLGFSSSLLESFFDSESVILSEFTCDGRLYFSDDSASMNARYAIVDVPVDSKKLQVMLFAATEDPYTLDGFFDFSPEQIEARYAETEAVSNVMSEEYGIVPQMPSYFPQILMALDSKIVKQFDFSGSIPAEDWKVAQINSMTRMVTSHLEPQHVSTFSANADLGVHKLKFLESASDDAKLEALMRAASWAYLGELFGDASSSAQFDLLGLRKDIEGSLSLQAELLEHRGWDEQGIAHLTQEPSFEDDDEDDDDDDDDDESGATVGLTKSSTSSGLGKLSNSDAPASGGKNFCSNCGSKFESAKAKFCSECGESRE